MLTLNATFIFCFISFIIFVFLMKMICYAPIMRIIGEREKLYEKNKKTVADTNLKTDQVTKEFNEEISKTKLQGSKILKNTVELNEAKKAEVLGNKKQEIANSIQEYKTNVKMSAKSSKQALKSEISDYVKGAVSKVLKISKEEVKFDESKIDEILK